MNLKHYELSRILAEASHSKNYGQFSYPMLFTNCHLNYKLMNEDYHVKKPKDLTKINSNDFGELLWWSYYFATSPEKLLSIIQKTGNAIEDVKKNLTL